MMRGDEAKDARIAGLEEMLAFTKKQLEEADRWRVEVDAWKGQAEVAQRLLIDARPRRFSWFRRGENE